MMVSRECRTRLSAFLLLGAVATAGCSRGKVAAEEAAPAEGWSLTVINHHWLDVSVYVVSEGVRARVGTVVAARTDSYELPGHLISNGRLIHLEGNPIGATQNVRTEALSIQAGQHVEWRLESGLERSTVAVW